MQFLILSIHLTENLEASFRYQVHKCIIKLIGLKQIEFKSSKEQA